ncbi:hypothetical protein TNCV_4696271 [Trichonephila clavipes]|nr:hypothetical protein TNCV_4696271 [Trichonephila clavipes]
MHSFKRPYIKLALYRGSTSKKFRGWKKSEKKRQVVKTRKEKHLRDSTRGGRRKMLHMSSYFRSNTHPKTYLCGCPKGREREKTSTQQNLYQYTRKEQGGNLTFPSGNFSGGGDSENSVGDYRFCYRFLDLAPYVYMDFCLPIPNTKSLLELQHGRDLNRELRNKNRARLL